VAMDTDTDDLARRPWVLLPGTLCTGAVFDGMLDVLGVPAAHRQVVALKWPFVEDYGAVFDAMPEDAIVCGFSLGAIVAAHHADRMAAHRLVLFGVNPYADDPLKAVGRRELAQDVGAMGGAAALRARAPDLYGPAPDTARAMIHAMADADAGYIAAQTQLALTRPGALPALARAQMPVLVLTGSRDGAAPPAQGQAAATAAPCRQFYTLEGLGHFALLENPDACAAALMHMMDPAHEIA